MNVNINIISHADSFCDEQHSADENSPKTDINDLKGTLIPEIAQFLPAEEQLALRTVNLGTSKALRQIHRAYEISAKGNKKGYGCDFNEEIQKLPEMVREIALTGWARSIEFHEFPLYSAPMFEAVLVAVNGEKPEYRAKPLAVLIGLLGMNPCLAKMEYVNTIFQSILELPSNQKHKLFLLLAEMLPQLRVALEFNELVKWMDLAATMPIDQQARTVAAVVQCWIVYKPSVKEAEWLFSAVRDLPIGQQTRSLAVLALSLCALDDVVARGIVASIREIAASRPPDECAMWKQLNAAFTDQKPTNLSIADVFFLLSAGHDIPTVIYGLSRAVAISFKALPPLSQEQFELLLAVIGTQPEKLRFPFMVGLARNVSFDSPELTVKACGAMMKAIEALSPDNARVVPALLEHLRGLPLDAALTAFETILETADLSFDLPFEGGPLANLIDARHIFPPAWQPWLLTVFLNAMERVPGSEKGEFLTYVGVRFLRGQNDENMELFEALLSAALELPAKEQRLPLKALLDLHQEVLPPEEQLEAFTRISEAMRRLP